jgi:peptidoglycan/LPS O-acetylase OafA/YrhL
LNIVFLHGLSPSANNEIVPGGWSIGAEMIFYAVFPALYPLACKVKDLFGRKGLFGLLLIFIINVCILQAANYIIRGNWIQNNSFPYFLIINQFPAFMIGIIYYLEVYLKGARIISPAQSLFCALLTMCVATASLAFEPNVMIAFTPSIVSIGFVFLAEALREAPTGWFGASIVAGIGASSFSIYILHFGLVWGPVWIVVEYAHFSAALQRMIFLPLLAACMVTLMIVGAISRRFIEEPGISIGRRVIRVRRSSASQGSNA